MKKILAFGASNSVKSINKQLAIYTAKQLEEETIIADLNDFELPLYQSEWEQAHGIPENAKKFSVLIEHADAIVVSFAEHNGLPSAAFKNLFDWMSRIDSKVWKNKPMFLMATSPGARGGANVLQLFKEMSPRFAGKVIATFSLPSFYENFSDDNIPDPLLKAAFETQLNAFKNSL